MNYNSSYSHCFEILLIYETGGDDIPTDAGFVLPIGPGLTKDNADARNPAGETSYNQLVVYDSFNIIIHKMPYYLVTYEHMKVCACIYTCGLNGFKYAMLWKQYFNLIFFKSIINIC